MTELSIDEVKISDDEWEIKLMVSKETVEIRNKLQEIFVNEIDKPNFKLLPKSFWDDMFDESRLTEEKCPRKYPKVGSAYQAKI